MWCDCDGWIGPTLQYIPPSTHDSMPSLEPRAKRYKMKEEEEEESESEEEDMMIIEHTVKSSTHPTSTSTTMSRTGSPHEQKDGTKAT